MLKGIKNIFKSKKNIAIDESLQPIFDCNGTRLKVGQVCKMKFVLRAESKVGYYVGVQELDSSCHGCKTGLQTYIPQMHSATLHEYWSKCLEVVGNEDTHGHLLFNQKI